MMRETKAFDCPSSKQGILELVRSYLSHNTIHTIVIRPGVSIEVDWSRGSSDSLEQLDGGDAVQTLFSRVQLTTLGGQQNRSATSALFAALLTVNNAGMFPRFALATSVRDVAAWLGVAVGQLVPIGGTHEVLLPGGIRLREVPSDVVPDGKLVILASSMDSDVFEEMSYGIIVDTEE